MENSSNEDKNRKDFEDKRKELEDKSAKDKISSLKKDSDVIKIKIPSFGNVTGKLRKNPWMTATFVLIILSVILVFSYSDFSGTGKIISENDAAQKVINLVETDGSNVELIEVNSVSGFYEVVLLVDGQQGSLYVSKDGRYLLDLIPFPEDSEDSGNAETQEEDWSVFENSLPENIQTQILNFPEGVSEDFNSELGIKEFTNFEEIQNTFIVLYREGCSWCSKEYSVLLGLEEKYPELEIYALDYSQNTGIAQKYNARGTPANIINGKYFVSGYRSLDDFEQILTEIGY